MRLIDADALIESFHDNEKHKPLMAPFNLCTADIVDLKFLLNDEPAIDAVPVVRCQECKHHHDCGQHFCDILGMDCPDDSEFFCSYGERKEGAEL